MTFKSTIIVVDDVLKSRKLYETILGCEIESDFGIYNVGYKGGLALYKRTLFEELIGTKEIISKANNFVIYFEFNTIETIQKEIETGQFEFIHKIKEQPWGQNVFRFYDYDKHIIEIAEKMQNVFKRMKNNKMTIEQIAEKTGYNIEDVKNEMKILENP